MFDDMAFPCQGGNKMSKGTRKISVAVVTVSLAATTAFGVIKANNIYDDSTIGLSSALDRYVESVQLETASAGDGSTPTDASSETVKTETAKTETKKTCFLLFRLPNRKLLIIRLLRSNPIWVSFPITVESLS